MADGVIEYKVNMDTSDADDNVNTLGDSMASLGLAIAGALATKAVFEFGTAFESSFAKVQTLINNSVANLDKYQQGIKDLSLESGIAADELNEGLYQAISAGVEVTEDGAIALEFMETASKLARGGFTDTAKAVDALTSVINAYGLESEDANRIANIFMKTQNEGKTTVDELASSISLVSPIAANLGLDFEQVGAAMAALTATGTSTRMSTNMLKTTLTQLTDSTKGAGAEFLKISGVSFREFIAQGGNVSEALQLMTQYAEDNNLEMGQLFDSSVAARTALVLGGSGAEAFADALLTMNDGIDSVTEASDIMSDTIDVRMTKVMNEAKLAFVEIFEAVAPFLTQILQFITSSGVLMPIIMALTAALIVFAAVNTMVNLVLLANPITLIILAVIALIAIVAVMIANWEIVAAFFTELWKNIVNGVVTFVKAIWDAISPVIQPLVDFIMAYWNFLVSFFTSLWNLIKMTFDAVWTWMQPFVDKMKSIVETMKGPWEDFKDFIGMIWEGIIDAAKLGVNLLVGVLNNLISNLEGGVNIMVGGINDLIDTANKVPGVELTKLVKLQLPRIPKLAKGGLAFGPTMAMVGDNPGARVNPEVIAPLSELEKIIGGNNRLQLPTINLRVISELDGEVLTETVIRNIDDVVRLNQGGLKA